MVNMKPKIVSIKKTRNETSIEIQADSRAIDRMMANYALTKPVMFRFK